MAKSESRSRDWKRLLRLWALGPASGTIGAMKFITAHGRDYWAWLIYAECKWSMAQDARARWALRRAAWVAPDRFRHRLPEYWGKYYSERGDLPKAELWFRRALRAVPSTQYYVLLGKVLAKQGRVKEAETLLGQAIRVRTAGQAVDEAHFHLGLTLRAGGRYKDAAAHFRAALRIDPRYTLAQRALRDVLAAAVPPAKGLSRRQAWAHVLRAWDRDCPATLANAAAQFTKAYPRCYRGWIMLAHGTWDMHRYDAALKALRRAQSVVPPRERATLFLHRGWFFRARGNGRRAEFWFRRAVRAQPTTGHLIFLGGCLARQGKLEEAERVHRRAIRARTPGDAIDEAHLNLGLVLRALNRNREAATHFRAALRIDPRCQHAKEALRDVVRARAEHATYRVRR
jgi:tetratricopeptide (TPR) repeat protein